MSNRNGDAYAFMSITPVLPGHEDDLHAYLQGFTQQTSPFASLAQTHFGRWVIIKDWVNSREQPHEDHLGCAYLIFTSNFNGSLDAYLGELCELSQAPLIWGHCIGAPNPAAGTALAAYLKHNQIDTGFFYSAYPNASVAQVNAGLELRDSLIGFAASSQCLDATALKQAFDREFR